MNSDQRSAHAERRGPVPVVSGGTEPDRAPPAVSNAVRLRMRLVALDVVALVAAFGLAFTGARVAAHLEAVASATLAGLVTLAGQRLYRSRVCDLRAVELAAVVRAVAVAAAVAAIVANRAGVRAASARAAVGGAVALALVASGRSAYRAWLRSERARGRRVRPVVLVGTDDDARTMERLLAHHPETGLRVTAVVGDAVQHAALGFDAPIVGGYDEAVDAAVASGASGAIVMASAVPSAVRGRTVRRLLAAGLHVQLSPGVAGFDVRRLRAQPVAHEPLLYLEPVRLAPWQAVVKRVTDVVLASIALALSMPVLALAAIAIKLDDGGPVLYRHARIGRDGRPFRLLKLRTMVRDADELIVDLTATNERRDGPLFKMEGDPRVTRAGRVLRAASIDELPQLVNVLRGTMALVGPRPALAREVEHFDDELRERLRVLPGITGLWQLEGRDKSSFDVYRRLDLFYLENWSLSLDLAILLATIPNVIARPVRVLRHQPVAAPTPIETVVAGKGVSSL